ncbi:MAG: hypothetical protein ACD_79C00422G0009 [uncultured bacterium]|nr:MAG: hypothetical protein ACD_79C00422G0009 [uncultured bacterium]
MNQNTIDKQNKKILVVDDDPNLLELMSQILTIYEINCDTAINGEDALTKLENKFYDIIVTDIKMPVMDGTELVKNVRKIQEKSITKSTIILMTAYSTSEIIDLADKLSVTDFFTKPFDINKFVERIIALMQGK